MCRMQHLKITHDIGEYTEKYVAAPLKELRRYPTAKVKSSVSLLQMQYH